MFGAVVKMASEEGVFARRAAEREKRPAMSKEQSDFSPSHGKKRVPKSAPCASSISFLHCSSG